MIDAEESRAKAFLHKCTLDANILSCYAEVVETHKDALLSISNEYIKDEKIKGHINFWELKNLSTVFCLLVFSNFGFSFSGRIKVKKIRKIFRSSNTLFVIKAFT